MMPIGGVCRGPTLDALQRPGTDAVVQIEVPRYRLSWRLGLLPSVNIGFLHLDDLCLIVIPREIEHKFLEPKYLNGSVKYDPADAVHAGMWLTHHGVRP